MLFLLQTIFPFLVLFYLADSFSYVDRFGILFYSHFGGKYRTKAYGYRFFGISPFCRCYISTRYPFFVSRRGMYLWKRKGVGECDLYERRHFEFLPLSGVRTVDADGSALRTNGSVFMRMASSSIADYIADKAGRFSRIAPRFRTSEYGVIFKSPAIIKQIEEEQGLYLHLIGVLGSALFIYVFLLLPVAIYMDSYLRVNAVVFLVMLLYSLVVALSLRTYHIIYGNRRKTVAFLFSLVFSPVSAIHAVHLITRNIAADINWMLLASCLLRRESFERILFKEMRRIHYSIQRCGDEDLMEFLLSSQKECLCLLKGLGLTQGDVFSSPERGDPLAQAYCPLCETEFVGGSQICPDCGIELLSY